MSHASKTHGTPWRLYAACLGGAAILALLIYLGHWPHILQVLPLLLVAACPLMHLFMHRHRHDGP